MSLIGPRPERPEFDQFLSRKIPNYELRHFDSSRPEWMGSSELSLWCIGGGFCKQAQL